MCVKISVRALVFCNHVTCGAIFDEPFGKSTSCGPSVDGLARFTTLKPMACRGADAAADDDKAFS